MRIHQFMSFIFLLTTTTMAVTNEYAAETSFNEEISQFAKLKSAWIRSYAFSNNIAISSDLKAMLDTCEKNNLDLFCMQYEKYHDSHAMEYTNNAHDVSFNRLCQHPLKEIYATCKHYQMADCNSLQPFLMDLIKTIPSNSVLLASGPQMRFLLSAPCAVRTNLNLSVISPTMFFDTSYMAYVEAFYGNRFRCPDENDYNQMLINSKKAATEGLLSSESLNIISNPTSDFTQVEIAYFNSELLKLFIKMNDGYQYYYEEYAMFPWTYDFLTPHDFIMRLDVENKTKLTDDVIEDSNRFWSGYLANTSLNNDLLDSKYMLFFLGKLRLSFANLYRHHRMGYHAENAYIQSYLIEPENTYGTILLALFYTELNRQDYAIFVLSKLKKKYPDNKKVDMAIDRIKQNKESRHESK